MTVDWFEIPIVVLPAIIPMIIPSIFSIMVVTIFAIIYAMRHVIKQKITEWILKWVIFSETPEKYIESLSTEALEKLHQIIVERYLISTCFSGIPWQKKLFKKIASIDYTFCQNNYRYTLTKEEIEFVWKGGVDNWTMKDLSESGDYNSNDIRIFKHNVEEIKKDIKFRICAVSINIYQLFFDSASTACKIEALNDDLLLDNIEMAPTLTEIQASATELFNISTGSSMKYHVRSLSHDDEYVRKVRGSVLNITNVYERLHYIQHEIEKLMYSVNNGINNVSDNISKYECLGDDEHANVEMYNEMHDDLTSIQMKLVTIHDLVAILLPKDESPAKT